MATTNNYGLTFPEENTDPWFDGFTYFANQIGDSLYGLNTLNQPLLGGGTLSLQTLSQNPYQGKLSWTEDFEFLIPTSQFLMTIPFGPDQATRQLIMNDLDRVIISSPIPLSSASSLTSFLTTSQAPLSNLKQNLVLGVYRKGIFYSNYLKNLQGN